MLQLPFFLIPLCRPARRGSSLLLGQGKHPKACVCLGTVCSASIFLVCLFSDVMPVSGLLTSCGFAQQWLRKAPSATSALFRAGGPGRPASPSVAGRCTWGAFLPQKTRHTHTTGLPWRAMAGAATRSQFEETTLGVHHADVARACCPGPRISTTTSPHTKRGMRRQLHKTSLCMVSVCAMPPTRRRRVRHLHRKGLVYTSHSAC